MESMGPGNSGLLALSDSVRRRGPMTGSGVTRLFVAVNGGLRCAIPPCELRLLSGDSESNRLARRASLKSHACAVFN
jgi:hypothetical protein